VALVLGSLAEMLLDFGTMWLLANYERRFRDALSLSVGTETDREDGKK
jgi:hypothetical protein